MKLRTAVVCCLALLAGGRTASALPLAYDEAISGDLAYPYQTLNLDAGVNSIRGTYTYDLTHRFEDKDHFLFVVPEGMELLSFAFSLNPIVNGKQGTRVSLRLYEYPNYVNIVANGWLRLFNATDGQLLSRPIGQGLGAGLYHLFTGDVTEPGNATFAQFAYRFQLNVRSLSPEPDPTPTPTPVPEPATWSLLALGLAGIRARRLLKPRREGGAAGAP